MRNIVVRLMAAGDATDVARLSEQLGYPITPERILERFRAIIENADNGFFVAFMDEELAGWVHVYGVHLLESPSSFAEIGGLVVDAGRRRAGIGGALMAKAEEWAQGQGYTIVRLRSGLHREDAHRFYEAIGYTFAKTSHMYERRFF